MTENGKNEIISWPKIRNDIKIKVIPCCVDLNLFNPNNIKVEDQITAKEKLKITQIKTITEYLRLLEVYELAAATVTMPH